MDAGSTKQRSQGRPLAQCGGRADRRGGRTSERTRNAAVAATRGTGSEPRRGHVMNGLDLAVVAVLRLAAVFAFARGFVREALSIVAWIGAALITLYGFNYLYRIVIRFITTPLLAELTAAAGLFLVSLIVLTILTGYVARVVQSSALSPIDR